MNSQIKRKRHSITILMMLMLAAVFFSGCSKSMHQTSNTPAPVNMKHRWGVEPVALRLIGGDHFIDFRYRVLDPDKAVVLLKRNNKPYLIDEATGKVHTVPMTKLGPMRASAVKPKADRNYTVIFGNSQKIIKRGSKVTVVIGDFRAEHLIVM